MSRRTNLTVIGLFVIGAVALLFAGIITLGGRTFLAEGIRFVVFFQGSVKGLTVGAPVNFRGARVGSVVDMSIEVRPDASVVIPVIIEVQKDRIKHLGDGSIGVGKELMQGLIDKGLRAQLSMESFVTGQLNVSLDFYPKTSIRLAGVKSDYMELPSIASPFEELSRMIESLPIEQLSQSALNTLGGLEQLINSEDTKRAIAQLDETVEGLNKLVTGLNEHVIPAAMEFEKLGVQLNSVAGPVGEDIRKISADSRASMAEIRRAVSTLERSFTGNAPVIRDLTKALTAISDAARSVEHFVDYLERHPDSLLKGKSQSGNRP